MQTSIHPTYYEEATVTCVCGKTFVTGSTLPKIATEICSNCHPFYTGEKKFVDTTGRVDRFKKLAERAEKKAAVHAAVKAERAKKAATEKKEGKAVKTKKSEA
ncbi:MAG: 50S ribosomal protein L31 [Candidatus Moraniibacteriota bacterium]|nr:MAG: 50S ribosomal protein L31 [Candidatus Moranbacteria bacterium]